MLHIADAMAQEIKRKDINKVCFIGTTFTMEEDFITGKIAASGIELLVPDSKTIIDDLHRIIHKELTFGKIEQESKS